MPTANLDRIEAALFGDGRALTRLIRDYGLPDAPTGPTELAVALLDALGWADVCECMEGTLMDLSRWGLGSDIVSGHHCLVIELLGRIQSHQPILVG